MKKDKNPRPEWAPENAGSEFACTVMPGISLKKESAPAPAFVRRGRLSTQDYVDGVLAGDRMILSRAITLIESNAPKHFEQGQEIVHRILPYTGKSMRVGVTGVPGAGKSTFIEALGSHLCDEGFKVAVLAVDPSSTITGGSILGDKTRMETLVRKPNAFIRPSPSGGSLGGVTRKSRETLLLCEAAGYDVAIVETVGVGQSETTVRSMVDFFLVLVITGAGDDLQGIKKGIIEIADAILVNKADGDNKLRALTARADYAQVLHYLRPATEGWTTGAYTCSSITGEGIKEIWQVIENFKETTQKSEVFLKRRHQQVLTWVRTMAEEYLHNRIAQNKRISERRDEIERSVIAGKMTPTTAAKELITSMESLLFK